MNDDEHEMKKYQPKTEVYNANEAFDHSFICHTKIESNDFSLFI